MIDFHCHLDLYPDPEAVTRRAIESDAFVLAVTTTPLAWQGTNALVGAAKKIRVAMGLHPELVGKRAKEADILCERLTETKYVGEVGLDGSPPHQASFPVQVEVFDRVLSACSRAGGKILSVHSRGASAEVLDAIERHPTAGTVVLHWFSGSAQDLARAVRLGCWFSVGPAMVRGEKGRQLVARMPQEHVITESDGPFARQGDGPLFPWDVEKAVVQLAALWNVEADQADSIVMQNFRRLLGV